jgi:Family of unknown function (DUF6338)
MEAVPTSLEALLTIGIAILPGATFVWGMEREIGSWWVDIGERILRFVALSLIFQVILAPVSYSLYRNYILTGRLSRGTLPTWVWFALLLYAIGPLLLGWLFGLGIRKRSNIASEIFGPQAVSPAAAWDYMFSGDKSGYVRLLLKTDPPMWVAGTWTDEGNGRRAFASSAPEHRDIFLQLVLKCDNKTGKFVRDAEGNLVVLGGSMLVRYDEVHYLEFIEG